MIDFGKVQSIIEEELGTRVYRARVMQIATILDRLDMDNENGAEELIAKEVVNRVLGKVRYIKKKDVMDANPVGRVISLESIIEEEKNNNIYVDREERIKDFINLGSVNINHNEKRTMKAKIDQIKEIEEKITAGKTLIEIEVGKQTANDWLADVTGKLKIGENKFIKDRIEKLREKSQKNYIKSTATDLIRREVTRKDLKNMSSRDICEKYDFDYNGSTRKFISRLKLKLEAI
jgi:hypothetical protein